MRVFGLTGGIASGKSTVRRMLESLGATVIDADVLAREVVVPGSPALAEIAGRFPGVLSPDGTLDRAALGRQVFADPVARQALDAIVHPRIAEAFERERKDHASRGVKTLIYDAALLIENGLHARLDGVLLVTLPRPVQVQRLIARDGLTATEAEARIQAQWPLERKLPLARWQVDNAGPETATRAQVERVWREMQGAS